MTSLQIKPIALSLLLCSFYLLTLQYEQAVNFFLLPSLPPDIYIIRLVELHPDLSAAVYFFSLLMLAGCRQELERKPFSAADYIGLLLLVPSCILLWECRLLQPGTYLFIYPASVAVTGIASSRLRIPELSVDRDTFGIRNPGSCIENEVSFNWKINRGYINVVNPFQGILIVGGAGSGKTYSLIDEIIRQAIGKGYAGFIYDYKYPELSTLVYTTIAGMKGPRPDCYQLNFTDIERSHRINPLHPDNIPVSAFAAEYAGVILKNLKKEWVNHADFWADNAISYLKALIWYLKKHEPACCSLPHVICLSLTSYPQVLSMLASDGECRSMIASLLTAYRENASAQVAGCISSLQTPMDKLNDPVIFWVLSGNDCDLDLNKPDHPAILTIGNNPQLSETTSPVISLVASVVMKKLNQKNKCKSLFLLDEAPTLFIPDLKNLPNTGRSNQVCTVYCCQDFSQMNVLYGADEARAIRASLANQFIGMVNDIETAELVCRMFGHMDKTVRSTNISSGMQGDADASYSSGSSLQQQEKNLIQAAEIMTLETGTFVGKTTQTGRSFFRGKPLIGSRATAREIPVFRKLILPVPISGVPVPVSRIPVPISGVPVPVSGIPVPESGIPAVFSAEPARVKHNELSKLLELNYKKIQLECEDILYSGRANQV